MPSLIKKILATVLVIAVVFAQVFGMQRGFTCDHNERVVETGASHCHELVVESREAHVPCEGPCDSSLPQEQHEPVVVKLSACSSTAAIAAPEFVAVPIFDMYVNEWAMTLPVPEGEIADRFVLAEGQRPPAAAVQVARSVVLLV